MAETTSITKGADGFYHPVNEDQIVALVKRAYAEKLKIRCRGAAHSISWAIYTDSKGIKNTVSEQDPPEGPNLNIMLDQMNKLTWIDEANGICEAEAGIHLGYDPEDPTGTSTLENSLLYQAFQKGWALSDLGGITHQTVGGFLSTGSAGGSLSYDLAENLEAFRVIDGMGNAQWVTKENTDLFNAMGVSLGLLGIITKVRFKMTPNFYIYGQQITKPVAPAQCPIDLFGKGGGPKPNMEEFLRATPYTRVLWWPQKGVDRVVIWEAVRGTSIPVFDPLPYYEFTDTGFFTQLEQIFGALLFTMLGNTNVFTSWAKMQHDFLQFQRNVARYWSKTIGKFLGGLCSWLVTAVVYIIELVLAIIFGILPFLLRWLYAPIVGVLQPLTKDGKALLFMDYMWRSLPMDNSADDILLGTEFTEIWIPIEHTARAMQLMDAMFKREGAAASGYNATELYAGYHSDFWMSPGYGGDMFRVDPFWYINNAGDPASKSGFFGKFWELFRANDIPFRLHWGKFLPEYDYKEWAEFFRKNHPMLPAFLKLRAERDPGDIFFTDYWRLHLTGQ